MKKTLTAMAIATSIIPVNNINAEEHIEDILLDDNTDETSHSEESYKTKSSLLNVTKDDSFLIDETGKKIVELKKGHKLQQLKSMDGEPFSKVNYNGRVLFIADNFVSSNESRNSSGTDFELKSIGEVANITSNDSLNVRSTDSTKGSILFKLKKGTKVNILERTKNGWYKIDYYGNHAFVNEKYINLINPTVVGDSFDSFSKVLNKCYAKKLPTEKSNNAFALPINAGVYTTKKINNGWYEIKYYNEIGYIQANNIKVLSVQENKPEYTVEECDDIWSMMINSPSTAAKKYPTNDSATLFDLVYGAGVYITGETSNGWYQIKYYNNTLYVPKDSVKKLKVETPSEPSKPEVPETPSEPSKPEAPETPSEPSKPEAPETPSKPEAPNFNVSDFKLMGVVYNVADDDVLNVRATPYYNGELITTLKPNSIVKITGKTSNNWYRVDINGTIGYINSSYIKEYNPETKNYEVVNKKINLRLSDNWSGEVYRIADIGEILPVISIENGWASIYIDNKIVYAPSNYLALVEDKQESVSPDEPNFTITTLNMDGIVYNIEDNDVLNIREYPNYNSSLVATLKNNTRVNVIGKTSNDWYKVNINGLIGYAHSNYIKEYIPETTKYQVINTNINLRLSPNWSGEIYRTVNIGEILNVISITDGWASVYIDGKTVYAPANYLSLVNNSLDNYSYTRYPYTLKEYAELQSSKNTSYSTSYFENYVNPLKCNKFEFLTLNEFRNVDVTQLNTMLLSQNAGVLIGQGQAIIDTCKKLNIDAIYFTCQSIHETGYGKSTLAKGVTITEIADESKPIKNENGAITGYEMIQLSEPVTVYNLYGIGAKDNLPTMPNRALILGTTYAYNQGWTSVEKAIEGAGQFVSSNYINSSKYEQNTLYKIRFNHKSSYIWHQYATSPWYSREIAKLMEKFEYLYTENNFNYEKPIFTDMNEYSINNTKCIDINDNHPVVKADITLN